MSAEVTERVVARRRWRAGSPAVALDKKARDVVVLDMRGVVCYTDFLVICTGNTERQTKAIEDGDPPGPEAAEDGPERLPERVEGAHGGALDPDGLPRRVVHIFTPAARDYYRLETLWGEVPALEVEQTA